MDQKLTISKVAEQSGLSVPSIRFYEAHGIVPAPARTDAGYRLYAPNDVRRLRLARRARLLGLSLPDVGHWSSGHSPRSVAPTPRRS